MGWWQILKIAYLIWQNRKTIEKVSEVTLRWLCEQNDWQFDNDLVDDLYGKK